MARASTNPHGGTLSSQAQVNPTPGGCWGRPTRFIGYCDKKARPGKLTCWHHQYAELAAQELKRMHEQTPTPAAVVTVQDVRAQAVAAIETVVTPERFGRDHWSLLAYVETRCVDYLVTTPLGKAGKLDLRHLRCNPERHPLLNANPMGDRPEWQPEWGTRLKGFFQIAHCQSALQLTWHDDIDCLDDLESAGYVEIVSLANACVKITTLGQQVAALLRQHKADGGSFANFDLALDKLIDS